jgi:glycosyltransferase involved in cell wall biosynthesis
VPDVQLITWAPFATARAVRLQKRHNFDAVITTSPLESAHAVGLAMSACGVPWIADLRDGWRFEAPREEWPLRAQRLLDDAFERAVVRRADQVVTISEPLSEDLRRRYGIAVETITNGFDPEEFERLSRANDTPVAVDQRKLTLVHTGRLGAERTLRPMLEALARMASVDATLHRRVELVLAGAQTEQEQAMYADRRFAPFVRHVGFLSREQAMALQHAADVLLLVTTGARTGEATGKLFEYLAAGRPILVLGDGSAAANIVAGVGAGASIPVRDPGAARAALEAILAEGMPVPPPSARDAYSYPTLAARYEQVLEQAIARRHGA